MNPELNRPGFMIESGGQSNSLHQQLQRYRPQAYQRFRASWNQLLPDPYLRDGGRYRLRRYSVFEWQQNKLTALPHEPHYQSSYYNRVHGGFNRHFRPFLPTTLHSPVLSDIVRWSVTQFSRNPAHVWRIQAHQFRILARPQEEGRPTPEGIHKDGADYILIMMMDRQNICGGMSEIYNNDMRPLAQYTLSQTGDLILVNDAKVYHGVTPITRKVEQQSAYRDVLVLTFHRQH